PRRGRSGGAGILTGQSKAAATLIYEHQTSGVKPLNLDSPGGAGLGVTLAGVQGLFVLVQPRRLIHRAMVGLLKQIPLCFSHNAQCSSRVASRCALNCSSKAAAGSSLNPRFAPGGLLGFTPGPRLAQRLTVL
ncbi:MAG: hypothetical protein N2318_05385, partial [Meiothermus sp.]|nr:hypothetical protein [Meiothermus sp.]